MQILDGQARKLFKELLVGSVVGIEALDDIFLKHWGERDHLYYITEFSNLKRENGESISNFTKRFNNMYSKIPTEIKPTDTSTRITYANAFDFDFFLLLRERRSSSLSLMQDAALEVESNIVASQKVKGKIDRKKRPADPIGASSLENKIDKMTKLLDNVIAEMSKLKDQGKIPVKGKGPSDFSPQNPNFVPYRRGNPQVQLLRRERNQGEYWRIRAPF